MDVVVHQAVRIDLTAEFLLEIQQILPVIGEGCSGGEYCLTVVSPLYDMMGRIGKDYAWLSRHVWNLAYSGRESNK